MIWGDLNWFMLALWAIVMILGLLSRKSGIRTMGSILGVIFGVFTLRESSMAGLMILCLNLYVLYDSLFSGSPG